MKIKYLIPLLLCLALLISCQQQPNQNETSVKAQENESASPKGTTTQQGQAQQNTSNIVPDSSGGVLISSKKLSNDEEEMFAAVKAAYQASRANADKTSREKLVYICITAGDANEFFAQATVYGEYFGGGEKERGSSVSSYRFKKASNGYKQVASPGGGIGMASAEGLTPLQKPLVKAYESLTDAQRWIFYLNGGQLKVYAVGQPSKDVPLLPQTQQDDQGRDSAVNYYSYGWMGGQLAVAGHDGSNLCVLTSSDGEKWSKSSLTQFTGRGIEGASLSFYTPSKGILAVDSDRQMGYHCTSVYTTEDGHNWKAASVPETSSRMMGVSRCKDTLFLWYDNLSANTSAPEGIPSFYRSSDGGKSWKHIKLQLPNQDNWYFNTVESITFEEKEGVLLVTGGEGSRARYLSHDGGINWQFDKTGSYIDF